jgi:hypothetical protein
VRTVVTVILAAANGGEQKLTAYLATVRISAGAAVKVPAGL